MDYERKTDEDLGHDDHDQRPAQLGDLQRLGFIIDRLLRRLAHQQAALQRMPDYMGPDLRTEINQLRRELHGGGDTH